MFRTDLPNIGKVQERDLYGRNAETLCVNNPDYQNFFTGLVEDYTRSYDIDGVMWGSERQGAFRTDLGPRTTHRRGIRAGRPASASFVRPSEERGMNVERAKEGFLELDKFVRRRATANGRSTATTSHSGVYCCAIPNWPPGKCSGPTACARLRRPIHDRKKRKPNVPVGLHIWHNNSFNPIYRAEQDLHELSNYSDFIKVVMYNNCGGERMALYADNIGSTLYGDLSKADLIDLNYALMGFKEGIYDRSHTGLSSDYVYRETKRALEGVAGTNTPIWPGIDIDIPTQPNNSKCTPQSVKKAVMAAFLGCAGCAFVSKVF